MAARLQIPSSGSLRLFVGLHLISFVGPATILFTPESTHAQPVLSEDGQVPPRKDFLLGPIGRRAESFHSKDGQTLFLENGLIRRAWQVPYGACVAFDDLRTGRSLIRSVRPEARLTIDGVDYRVGGLLGQPNQAFLKTEWLRDMKPDPAAMRMSGSRGGDPKPRILWKRRRHCAPDVQWPPPGQHIEMVYWIPEPLAIEVSVHYEMYDNLPAMSKWITVHNGTDRPITVDRFTVEEIAAVEQVSWVGKPHGSVHPHPDYLHVETDFAFGGSKHQIANAHVVHWRTDPDYTSQVNYQLDNRCLLVVEPTYGPAQEVKPGETFESFRVFELVYDSSDRERRGLTLRRFYRTLAPWVTENPITHHLLSSDPVAVKRGIDQAAEVGFEAVILSFGSGFNMESTDPEYLATWKKVADYAEEKGIELGAYSLFSSRKIGGGHDVVAPKGQRPAFGNAPAATSEWGIAYFKKIRRFFDEVGFDQFENDGPYPGDVDVTPRPPYQKGEQDSRWAQWKIVTDLYEHLRATGVYINQPDHYFFNGGNKTGMGYREVNWSLPRAHQIIHTRQNIYDGTWTFPPSMGWMHVPLAEYQGGGAAATVEPLDEHLDHYERIMLGNLGFGVQAHYRGPRLFDTDRTKAMVKRTIAWYKKYRDILESDLIHGRRADGRDLDWMLHVNPGLRDKGMLMIHNPLSSYVTKRIRVNLYYTGLTDTAVIGLHDTQPRAYKLDRDYTVELEVTVPPEGMSWYVIRRDSAKHGEAHRLRR